MMKRTISALLLLLLLAALLCACGGEKTDDTRGDATLPTLGAPDGIGNPVVDPWDTDSQTVPSLAPGESGESGPAEKGEKNGNGNAQDGTEPWPSLEPAPSLPSSLTPSPSLPSSLTPTPSQPAPSQPAPSQPAPRGETEEDLSTTAPSYADTDEDLNP